MDEKTLKSITAELDKNTMFHLSLGSKELFHSNFLEFLWDKSPEAFSNMLSNLLPERTVIEKQKGSIKLEAAREKENFDFCIFHKVYNEEQTDEEDYKIEYDVIIENKVKSIPYLAQLNKYEEKVNKNSHPIYILLSLSTDFADAEDIRNETPWNIVSYQQLAKQIKNFFIENVNIESEEQKKSIERAKQYIEDYYNFIIQLDLLQKYCLENKEKFFSQNNTDLKELREIRLHDFYLKFLGSYFIGEIYKKVKKKIYHNNSGERLIVETENRKQKYKEVEIFLSSGMNNSNSTITAAISHTGEDGKKVFYTIQIEGKAYRHMYNKENFATDCCEPKEEPEKKPGKRVKVKSKTVLKELKGKSTLDFLLFKTPFEVSNFEGELSDYCKYAPDVVYKYKEIKPEVTFDKMLEIMENDIIQTYNEIHKLN